MPVDNSTGDNNLNHTIKWVETQRRTTMENAKTVEQAIEVLEGLQGWGIDEFAEHNSDYLEDGKWSEGLSLAFDAISDAIKKLQA